jgi:hypothetical protein
VFDDDLKNNGRLAGIEHAQSTYSDLGCTTQPASDLFAEARAAMANAMAISCTANTGSQVFDEGRLVGIETTKSTIAGQQRDDTTSSEMGGFYKKRVVQTQPSA